MELVDPDAVPMPDDFDSEEQSPYLRRKKLVPIRRNRFSRRWRVGLLGLAALASIGVVAYLLAAFALNSAVFVLASPDDVVITGNHYVLREDVLGALEVPLTRDLSSGRSIFHISVDNFRLRIETLSWVRSATVTRILPHGLLVHVTERTPIAYANMGGRVSLIDEDGMLLEKTESGAFDFPVVYGLERSAGMQDRRARLAMYRDFIHQLDSEAPRAGWTISEVYLSDPEDLKAVLSCGPQTVIAHFGEGDFLQRFQRFVGSFPEMQKSGGRLDSVDLRYRNQVVMVPQASEEPASPAVPAGDKRKE